MECFYLIYLCTFIFEIHIVNESVTGCGRGRGRGCGRGRSSGRGSGRANAPNLTNP